MTECTTTKIRSKMRRSVGSEHLLTRERHARGYIRLPWIDALDAKTVGAENASNPRFSQLVEHVKALVRRLHDGMAHDANR